MTKTEDQVEAPKPAEGGNFFEQNPGLVAVGVATALVPVGALLALATRGVLGRFPASAWWALFTSCVMSVGVFVLSGFDPGAVFGDLLAALSADGVAGKVTAWLAAPGPLLAPVSVAAGCVWTIRSCADVVSPWTAWKVTRAERRISQGMITDSSAVTVGLSLADEQSRVVLPQGATNTGTLVLGATGAGKTTGVLSMLTDAIASGSPCVYVDLKGSDDVPLALAGLAEKYNRPFWHFSLYDANGSDYVGPTTPASYNPGGYGDATRRKDLLVGVLNTDVDYYKNTQSNYILTAFDVLLETGSFDGKSAFTAFLEVSNVEDLYRLARGIPESSPRREGLLRQVEDLRREASSKRDFESTIGSARNYINTIVNSAAGPFISPEGDVIDFEEVDATGGVVCFSLSDSSYHEIAPQLGTLVIQDFSTYAGLRARDGIRKHPFFLVVDEFSALGGDNILSLIARGRSAGVHTILATQNLADLHRAGDGFREQVTGTMGSFVFFRANTRADSELMSGLTGDTDGDEKAVKWADFQKLNRGECVVINKQSSEKDKFAKGWVCERVLRARVVRRDVEPAQERRVQLQVKTSAAGNWIAERTVDDVSDDRDWMNVASPLPEVADELYREMVQEPVLSGTASLSGSSPQKEEALEDIRAVSGADEESFDGFNFTPAVSEAIPADDVVSGSEVSDENGEGSLVAGLDAALVDTLAAVNPPSTRRTVSSSVVREWARENNVEVSVRGGIKKDVYDAYWAAQGAGATSASSAPVIPEVVEDSPVGGAAAPHLDVPGVTSRQKIGRENRAKLTEAPAPRRNR